MLCYVIPMLMTLVMHLCSPCNRRTINFYDDDDGVDGGGGGGDVADMAAVAGNRKEDAERTAEEVSENFRELC